jgi:hypothetical protein
VAYSAALLACAPVLAATENTDKPNILFVLIDDMGWKDIGCAGSTYYETPHIDELASEGTRHVCSGECLEGDVKERADANATINSRSFLTRLALASAAVRVRMRSIESSVTEALTRNAIRRLTTIALGRCTRTLRRFCQL